MLTFTPILEHSQGLHIYLVQNIFAHKGEGCFLLECFEDFSRTNSTRRTTPCDVCENSHVCRESRCSENNVCTRRLTHPLLLDDGVIFGENIVFVLGSCDHFFQCFAFFSQLCDHVIIKTDWCWQSKQMDTEFS